MEISGSRNEDSGSQSDQTTSTPSLFDSYPTITDVSMTSNSSEGYPHRDQGNGIAAPSAVTQTSSEPSMTSSSELEMAVTSLRLDSSEFQYSQSTLMGQGNFGAVYRARYRNDLVALKMLFGDQTEDFWREVNAMTATTHPNIVKILGIVKDGSSPLSIVSELMTCNLKAFMAANPNLSLFERLRLMRDAAMGVAFLHRHDPLIIHRDLKPENLLISAAGLLKLGDMGLCWTRGRDGEAIEPSDRPAGSVLYMGPEVLEGRDRVGTPSDVYPLGLLMWHIMTGQMPYAEWTYNTKPNFTHAIVKEVHRPPPILPLTAVMSPHASNPLSYHDMLPIIADIQLLINSMWQADPAERPTAQQVVDRLDAIILSDLMILPSHARAVWLEFQRQNWDQRHAVPFQKFWHYIRCAIESHPDISSDMLAIMAPALRVIFRIPETDENNPEITFPDFVTFFLTFSPQGTRSVAETMINFYQTMREGFFFGNLSRAEQTAKQNLCTSVGTIIVRYGNNLTPYSRLSICQLVLDPETRQRKFKLFNIRIENGTFSVTRDGTTFQAHSLRGLLELFDPDYVVPSINNPFVHFFVLNTSSEYPPDQQRKR